MSDIATDRDWVRARAACTLDVMFENLTKQMQLDTKNFNGLSAEFRRDKLFSSEPPRKHAFEVFPAYADPDNGLIKTGSPDTVSVKMSAIHITVTRHLHDALTITPKWNEETLLCDLLVTGNPLTVWRISQKVLGDYFFG